MGRQTGILVPGFLDFGSVTPVGEDILHDDWCPASNHIDLEGITEDDLPQTFIARPFELPCEDTQTRAWSARRDYERGLFIMTVGGRRYTVPLGQNRIAETHFAEYGVYQ
jgi:hypothetical protein